MLSQQASDRQRQVDTLKIFNDSVTEIKPLEEYRVAFTLSQNSQLQFHLHVLLPPEFPCARALPLLSVEPSGALSHPWLTSNGRVEGAPGLVNFSSEHSELGRVVRAVIRELEARGKPTVAGAAIQNHHDERDDSNTGDPLLSLLSRLSSDQLRQLCESDDRCDELLDSLPPIRALESELEKLEASNEALAKETLAAEPQVESLRQQVQEKAATVQQLQLRYETLSAEHQRRSDKLTPTCIKESLQMAAAESDARSEQIAEDFLNRHREPDAFLDSFIAERMRSHERRARAETLHKQLRDLERAGY